MKIKIRNLYAVAYSVALKHCPGVGVGCCHKCFDKGHVRRSFYYWCHLVLDCHHQRTIHCLRQMSWQKVRHFAYFTYSHRPKHDSTTEPDQDEDQDQNRTRTGLDCTRLSPHRPLDMLHTLLARVETFVVFPHPFSFFLALFASPRAIHLAPQNTKSS